MKGICQGHHKDNIGTYQGHFKIVSRQPGEKRNITYLCLNLKVILRLYQALLACEGDMSGIS